MSTLNLKVITPERILYEGEVNKFIVRGIEGDLAVLPNHKPLTTILGLGEIRIYPENEERRTASCFGGFALISPDKAVLLCDVAEWPEEIDVQRAEAAKQRAEKRKGDPDYDMARLNIALTKALVRIDLGNIAEKYKKEY